jgi:Flp pilus assembly protein TadD
MSGNDALRRVGDAGTTRYMRSFRQSTRIAFALALVALAVAQSGCASFRGARAYQRGSQALDRGDAPVAISEFERAATLVPHASEVQNHLGIAYSMEGRWDYALSAFRRAVELDCDNQAAQRNLTEAQAIVASNAAQGSREGALSARSR